MEDVHDLGEPALSPGAVARRLGVAVGTLRSWDRRYGLGPRDRALGEHRRYAPSDVARLSAMCRLVGEGVPVAEAARVVLGVADGDVDEGRGAGGGLTLPVGRRGGPTARGLARAAIRLDTAQVLELLDESIAHDGVVVSWQRTIEPALLAVGRKWTETSGRYVEVEHLLSWCITVALHRVQTSTRAQTPFRARGALLACAPDEWHSLPLEVLAAALTVRGIPIRMLGAAVPIDALYEAVRRTGPACVVVWSHVPRTADLATLAAPSASRNLSSSMSTSAGHSRRTRVMAAGPGWAARRPTGIRVLTSLTEAIDACVEARNATYE